MWQTLTIDGGGWPLVVHCRGAGSAILLLPSLGRSAEDLKPVGEALAERGFRVVAMEFRGCGGSGGPLARLTVDDYARDVERVVDALSLAPVNLVGAPFGSRIVRRLVASRSPIVASAAIVAAGGNIAPDAATVSEARRFMAGLGKEQSAELATLARSLYFSPAFRDREGWVEKRWLAGWSIDAMMAQRAALHASGEVTWASETPLLILQGLDDRIAPPDNARRLKALLGARAELIEFADTGHMLMIERPREAAACIAEFIGRQVGIFERSH